MMKNNHLWQTLIITFCLWHMFAVAVYLSPRGGRVMTSAGTVTSPYILSLSQWQKWDIFAPDPLRKSSTYRIDRNAGDRWEKALVIDADHLGFFERAKETKILERMETNDWKALVGPYLRSMCPRINNAAGSELQLVSLSSILPKELSTLTHLSSVRLQTTEHLLGTYRCPSAS